ncbi:quinoprotein relay system zinc metallohydrolase 2 [Microvirga makkahensis]|uniref:Quinoprotein relay system zinc metallohydrolase 2 n=2 Tax=Microvirga makkahensis TaxID=1128670 RepID=A0A7X3SPF3_9HYPH|nr:quinoprotein relay system zinc metallohydrolase 2 [Microvirga makkahensis]
MVRIVGRCAVATGFGAMTLLPLPSHADQAVPLPVNEVAPGVFVHEAPIALANESNLGAIANLGFVIGRDGVAIIDTGGSLAAGERLLAAIRQRTTQPIRYVINTHMHPDHILGNAAFKAGGVTFVGHQNLPRALADREKAYLAANSGLIGASFRGTEIVPPTLLVAGTVELDLGNRRLRVEAWRTAHTNTDITVLDLATGTWFLGDLLFMGHLPALDGSLTGWIRTVRDLRSRPAARVVPGHGPSTAPWPEAAAPMEKYLTRLADDVRSSIRTGHTISEAAQQAARSEAGAWLLFNEFNPRNATAAFHELEWE